MEYTIEINTGTGGISLQYENVEELIRDVNENCYISNTCLKKMVKWLFNRGITHTHNVFKFDNVYLFLS